MKKLPTAITEEEFTKLINNTKKLHHKIAFLLGFGSGMRVSEVASLQPNNVHLKEKRVDVIQGKGGKDRPVPLPKGFRENMLQHLPLKCGVRSLQRVFKSTATRAGLLKDKPDMVFHSLRHGFATRMVSQGVPIHHIRTLMGHSNISTTNVYLEANPKEAMKSYEDLF